MDSPTQKAKRTREAKIRQDADVDSSPGPQGDLRRALRDIERQKLSPFEKFIATMKASHDCYLAEVAAETRQS